MKVLKHNKYKNSGLIFEILTRKLVSESMDNTPTYSASIIKRHFSRGTELHKEVELYHTLQESNVKLSMCDKLISVVLETHYNNIDRVKLIVEKHNLIGALKRTYNLDDFFSSRVTNYKLLASIYKIMEHTAKDNPMEYVKCRESIIESLSNTVKADELNEVQEVWKSQDRDIQKLAFKILIDKFNKKYNKLNVDQRKLLKLYLSEDINSNTFKDYVYTEVSRIQKVLNEKCEGDIDPAVRIKVSGVVGLLETIIASNKLKNEHVSSLLKYYELMGRL